MPPFRKYGCPHLFVFLRGRMLDGKLVECLIYFNDLQDSYDVVLIVQRMPASAIHQILLHVKNPVARGTVPFRFHLALYRTIALQFGEISVPITINTPGLRPLQAPLQASACALAPAMPNAEIHGSNCPIPGRQTMLTIGFISPTALENPQMTIRTPPGYLWPWSCNFSAYDLNLPGGRTFEFVDESMFQDCVVSADGRSVTFVMVKKLIAQTVWNYFTIHALNPLPEEVPATPEQDTWSMRVDVYYSGTDTQVGVPSVPLNVFRELHLRELPFAYNGTSWAMELTFRSISFVPTGGYIVLEAPRPFIFPDEFCKGENATRDVNSTVGKPLYVPRMPREPFRKVPAANEPLSYRSAPPVIGECLVTHRTEIAGRERLVVRVLAGELIPAKHEFRFPLVIENEVVVQALQTNPEEGVYAPMIWRLESMKPRTTAGPCAGGCCPDERLLTANGTSFLQVIDAGVFESYPLGSYRNRLVVESDYGGWKFSDDAQ
eukprot:gnl/MRDRNA2_/MRDRNA2_65029_c0_seq1.p1 gnl/MRDRNA2_/MRDRNA2_65029_c0~~gnl/MRDRNA2_/MRDRNA2_65029_c0_seq1.p1  ORF type:complete len:519 (-),score=55.38 gnl/MRDRNA2_/MRDRNA2_65029_c0_seq1:142-1614(-)